MNAIQDAAAALSDFGQTIQVAAIAVAGAGYQLFWYGPGELRLTSALRTDGILRGLGGLIPGAFTTPQRDAIPSGQGLKPYGMAILNPTTNRWEWNGGTDNAPVWQPLGSLATSGTYASIPAPSSANLGQTYFATDSGGLFLSTGSAWILVSQVPVRVSSMTGLPGPYDGQMIELVDNLANPTYWWRLRYNNGRSDPYKWEYEGGEPFRVKIGYFASSNNSGYVYSAAAFRFPRVGYWYARATGAIFGGSGWTGNPGANSPGVDMLFESVLIDSDNPTTGWVDTSTHFSTADVILEGEAGVNLNDRVWFRVGSGGLNGAGVQMHMVEVIPRRLS